jgi:hypothetical protein
MDGMRSIAKFLVAPAVCAVSFSFIIDTEYIRKLRLQRRVRFPVYGFHLNPDEKYVPNIRLVSDIVKAIESHHGGIHIIWEPQGAGKTTTLHKVLDELYQTGKISGIVSIAPPVEADEYSPVVWYRNTFRDELGNVLKKGERLSKLLNGTVTSDKPVVIVFDPLDDVKLTEDFDELTKDIARDSDRFKTYIVFYVYSNADMAKHMWNLNGRQKIDRLGSRNPVAYKWGTDEIDQWIDNYIKHYPESLLGGDSSPLRAKFRDLAVAAGTPEYLVSNAKRFHDYGAAGSSAVSDAEKSSLFRKGAWDWGKSILGR